MTDPLIGQILKDSYRIEQLIADGGMSRVYLAQQVSLGRRAAVKMLLPDFRDDDFIQLFLREARVCSQLNHPNIVSVLDFGSTADGLVFMVMEYLEGAALADIVTAQKGLTLANIAWVMESLCGAIRAAHQHNVVHRDLKPGNIMVANLSGGNSAVKVVDFGISKPMHEEHLKHTQLGTIMGTPGYLAPEQIRGIHINHLADVYGIGAILHFMITGEAPYRGASREIIMNRQLKEPPPPLTQYTLRDPACAVLQPIISKAMAIDPEQRFATVQDLWEAFAALVYRAPAANAVAAPALPDNAYQFVFSGQWAVNTDQQQAARKLQSSLRLSDAHTAALCSGKRIVIRKNLSLTDARRFQNLFEKCGAIGAIESSDERTRVVTPQPASLPGFNGAQPISVAQFVRASAPVAPSAPAPSSPAIASSPAASLPAATPAIPSTPAPISPVTGSLPATPLRRRHSRWIFAAIAVMVLATAIVSAVPNWRYAIEDHLMLMSGQITPQRGISADRIRLGMSAAFSGSARELGRAMQMGMQAYFNEVNARGGIHGRTIELHALDDGYEPSATLQNLNQFLDAEHGAFALIGNVGTPTTKAILPTVLDHDMLLFGTFSGARLLRNDPPDNTVFNYRASYAEETAALVHYFVKVAGMNPNRIAVFYQNDSYGRDGLSGVANAIAQYGVSPGALISASYQRNTAQVVDAIATLRPHIPELEGVIIIGTYLASARFINLMRVNGYSGQFANVSFVGAAALAEELKSTDDRKGAGVIVSQVVPLYDAHATGVLRYRNAMAKHFPNEPLDFVSLEGFVVAQLFCHALEKAGRHFTTESLIATLESLHDLDLGIGKPLGFHESDHQASHQVWGTVIDENGHFRALDLERIQLE